MKGNLVLLDFAVATFLDTEGLETARNARRLAVWQLGVLLVVGEAHDVADIIEAVRLRLVVLL